MTAYTFEEMEETGGVSETELIETHYLELPGNADESVRAALGHSAALLTKYLDSVRKADVRTVEIVYANDIDATVTEEDWHGNKVWKVRGFEVPDRVVDDIQETLRSLFGPAWVVARKPDKRESDGRSRQRLLVRRVVRTDFKYRAEDYVDARKIVEGIQADADEYGDLSHYPRPPADIRQEAPGYTNDDSPPESSPLDVYVYRTGTGTAHLIRGKRLRSTAVVDDVDCLCGHTVPSEAIRAGDVHHFAEYAYAFAMDDDVSSQTAVDVGNVAVGRSLNPMQVLRGDLCGSCTRDYCGVTRSSWSGRIRHYDTPAVNYEILPAWSEANARDLDWEPAPMEGR